MPKYRKKPVVIEAVQWNGHLETLQLFSVGVPEAEQELCSDEVKIVTLEGTMTAKHGDWIIRGVNGEFYPCKQDIFEKTYERVDNAPRGEERRHSEQETTT
jgi:hypothetical protein